ncbi:MAG TPA: PQQ-dependent sugar dehydrogenase [Azospirillaceae bacterium]|nr:PQQ-dependent sugar dehydrogenase [Azospirillaceae bacterium]
MRRGLDRLAAAVAAAVCVAGTAGGAAAQQEFATYAKPKGRHELKVVPVVQGLDHPWGMAFLPDGGILVTERTGKLRLVRDGKLAAEPVAGLPAIEEHGQGGLLDVALHPGFAQNRLVYLTYSEKAADGKGRHTTLARFRYEGGRAEGFQVLYRGVTVDSKFHFGSRIAFGPDGKVYISHGDRGDKERAQDLGDPAGSIIRLNEDGTVPPDNPFASRAGARPEIFTWGHRNPQGMAFQPGTGKLWAAEHGPQGGDEVNLVVAGTNYGWPVITYGANYGTGTKIGEGTAKDGMAQPVAYFVPSLALAGIDFYDGANLPLWRGDMVVALLSGGIARLDMDGERIVAAERLLESELPRTRDVQTGPDGKLYALVDAAEPEGQLVRLERR